MKSRARIVIFGSLFEPGGGAVVTLERRLSPVFSIATEAGGQRFPFRNDNAFVFLDRVQGAGVGSDLRLARSVDAWIEGRYHVASNAKEPILWWNLDYARYWTVFFGIAFSAGGGS